MARIHPHLRPSARALLASLVVSSALLVVGPPSAHAQTAPDKTSEHDATEVRPIFKKAPTPADSADDSAKAASKTDDANDNGIDIAFHPAYRVRSISVNPLDLNSARVRDVSWTEQRFRLDASLSKRKLGAIHIQLDALDGVLFGDNGAFGQDVSSISGVSLTAKRPNVVGWGVGLADGADPLNPDSYVPVLENRAPININYLYADIRLPIGLLRIGRQPLNYGATLSAHDGGPYNRWGVSKYSDGVDRILFGTKLDQVWRVLSGSHDPPDFSQDNGIVWAVFYDTLKQDVTPGISGKVTQFGTSLQLLDRDADWGGLRWRHLKLSGNVVYLGGQRFNSQAFGFPVVLQGQIDNFHVNLQYIRLQGHTREVSEGFAVLSGQTPQTQQIRAQGAHAVLDWDVGPVTLTLQGDYASGDPDPRPTNALTSFNFARDLNVGLLLFEHVLAFESARSVAVGIQNLAAAHLKSFPLTEASTQGRFTNALAIFPQANVDWIKTPRHHLHTRMGVLMAWPATSGGVVDPIMTNLHYDGQKIRDDAVNFAGGKPGDYYGTEVDMQLGYGFRNAFMFTLEGATLFPGNSLQDENGDAANSYMMEARLEVRL